MKPVSEDDRDDARAAAWVALTNFSDIDALSWPASVESRFTEYTRDKNAEDRAGLEDTYGYGDGAGPLTHVEVRMCHWSSFKR